MKYEAKTLINETGKTVEFMCGSRIWIFKNGEKKTIPGFDAYHALNEVNTGLKEYVDMRGRPGEKKDYRSIPWKNLLKLTVVKKFYKPGMTRENVLAHLEEQDAAKEARAL